MATMLDSLLTAQQRQEAGAAQRAQDAAHRARYTVDLARYQMIGGERTDETTVDLGDGLDVAVRYFVDDEDGPVITRVELCGLWVEPRDYLLPAVIRAAEAQIERDLVEAQAERHAGAY